MLHTYSFDNFFETSSKTNSHIGEMFLSVAKLAIEKNLCSIVTDKNSLSVNNNKTINNNNKQSNNFCSC